MKNIILASATTLICLLFVSSVNAQYYPDIEYKKGDVEFAVGLGLMNTFVDINTKSPLPPISLLVNYRLKKNISLGSYMGYSRTHYNPPKEIVDIPSNEQISLTNNYFQLGLRAQGHFTQDRMDFYGGAMLGYNFSINESSNLPASGQVEGIIVEDYSDIVIFSGFIGGKYLITEHLGVFGEVGYGVSIFNVGITTRF